MDFYLHSLHVSLQCEHKYKDNYDFLPLPLALQRTDGVTALNYI